jgi:ribosomal protein S18 acetylase RimI-like enzyme
MVRSLVATLEEGETAEPETFLEDPRTLAFAAEEDGAVVGWLYAYELVRPDGRRAMLLYELEVIAATRKRGHGRALVEALLAEARARGHFKVWVLADPDNAAAEALYLATGGAKSAQLMFSWVLPAPDGPARVPRPGGREH